MPVISVIIPARDAAATLPRALECLARQTLAPGEFEVIVVDDGSRDATAALATAARGSVRVISQSPSGPAAARNAGVAAAAAPALAFCDADVFPAPGWLEAGLKSLRDADLVQGRVVPDPSALVGPFDRTLWIQGEVGLYETANLFVARGWLERAGGFEAWLEPRSGKALAEDVWFGYRARRIGARTAYCADALAHHAVFARSWRGYVRERARVEYFPAMARQMPELRRTFLHRRVFLNPRTARFDLALAAGSVALATGSPLGLLGVVPYARALRTHAGRGGRPGLVALADLTADLVGALSLLAGSTRYRSPVL